MATITVSAPQADPSGAFITATLSATMGALTVDASKIRLTATDEKFDATGALTTYNHAIAVTAAAVVGTTLTLYCDSEHLHNDTTNVLLELDAGALVSGADSTDALSSTAVDLVTTPVTLDYEQHAGVHFLDAPHQRHTGDLTLRLQAGNGFGFSAVRLGITRALTITTDAGGITGTIGHPELFRFAPSGAIAALCGPGSDLSGAGSAKTVKVFVQSGTVAAADVATAAVRIATSAAGITGRLILGETLTFSGGSVGVVAPTSDLEGPNEAMNLVVFITSGSTPAGAETCTAGTSGATFTVGTATAGAGSFTVDSTAGGGETSSLQTAMSTRVCDSNNYGVANATSVDGGVGYIDCWAATLTPPAKDDYQRWAVLYPAKGDVAFDTRHFSVRATAGVMTGDRCRGELEIYCDPSNTDTFPAGYYVCYCRTATADTYSGTFGGGNFCLVRTGANIVNVVEAFKHTAGDGSQTASPFTYSDLENDLIPRQMTLAGDPTGGTPVCGDLMYKDVSYASSTPTGIFIHYDSGTKVLTYLQSSTAAFAASDAIVFRDADCNDTGVTCTAETPSTLAATVSSGDVITDAVSGAECTLTGSPADIGNDTTGNGTESTPYKTQQKVQKVGGAAKGDNLADGVICYIMHGNNRQHYTGTLDTETKRHYFIVTRAPGYSKELCRVVRYNTAAGSAANATNFQKFTDVTLLSRSSTGGVNVLSSNATIPGSLDRPAWWIDNCNCWGFARWSLGQINQFATGTTQPCYVAVTNSDIRRSTVVAQLLRDNRLRQIAQDAYTLSRCRSNNDADDWNAATTTLHADDMQYQSAEYGNSLTWGGDTGNLDYVQVEPFANFSPSTEIKRFSYGMFNKRQATDGTSNIAQFGVGSSTYKIKVDSFVRVNCTTQDDFWWRAGTVNNTLTLTNVREARNVFHTYDYTDLGTITGISRAAFYNNHFATSPGILSGTDTAGTALSACMEEVTDNDAADFLRPTAGVLAARVTLSAQPNGWPRYDVFGRALPSSAAVGAVQIPAPSIGTPTTMALLQYIPKVNYTDLTITFTVADAGTGVAGVFGRWQAGSESGYAFVVDADGNAGIFEVTSGTAVLLASGVLTGSSFTATMVGTDLTLSDGSTDVTASDGTYSSGSIGLFASAADAVFSYFAAGVAAS